MTNILCLTDFSATSNNAANYAAWFARQVNARLTLLHVLDEKALFSQLGKSNPQEQKERLTAKLTACRNSLVSMGSGQEAQLDCDVRIGEGNIADAVNHYCAQEQYDFVLMGTTGANKEDRNELMLGNTALEMFEQVTVPVLALPRVVKNRQLHTIVFGTDFQPADDAAIAHTLRLAAPFAAQVQVVHITYPGQKQVAPPAWFANPEAFGNEQLHFSTVQGANPETGVLRYAKETAADMIVLAGKEYGFFQKIFANSAVEYLGNYAAMPLLVYPASWKKRL